MHVLFILELMLPLAEKLSHCPVAENSPFFLFVCVCSRIINNMMFHLLSTQQQHILFLHLPSN